MELSSFSSLFELAAGLNAAFIAVDYASEFSTLMSEKVLKIKPQINDGFKNALKGLIDKETLDSLPDTRCGDSSTGVIIESIKRKRERLLQSTADRQKKLESEVGEVVSLRCHSSLSFVNFLFCFIMLFISTIPAEGKVFSDGFIVSCTFIVLLLQLSVWIWGEKKMFFLASIKNVFFIMLGVALFCGVLSLLVYQSCLDLPEFVSVIGMYIAAFLPYLGFLVFSFLLLIRLRTIRKSLQDNLDQVIAEKEEIMNEYDKVKTVTNVANTLTQINSKDDE